MGTLRRSNRSNTSPTPPIFESRSGLVTETGPWRDKCSLPSCSWQWMLARGMPDRDLDLLARPVGGQELIKLNQYNQSKISTVSYTKISPSPSLAGSKAAASRRLAPAELPALRPAAASPPAGQGRRTGRRGGSGGGRAQGSGVTDAPARLSPQACPAQRRWRVFCHRRPPPCRQGPTGPGRRNSGRAGLAGSGLRHAGSVCRADHTG